MYMYIICVIQYGLWVCSCHALDPKAARSHAMSYIYIYIYTHYVTLYYYICICIYIYIYIHNTYTHNVLY